MNEMRERVGCVCCDFGACRAGFKAEPRHPCQVGSYLLIAWTAWKMVQGQEERGCLGKKNTQKEMGSCGWGVMEQGGWKSHPALWSALLCHLVLPFAVSFFPPLSGLSFSSCGRAAAQFSWTALPDLLAETCPSQAGETGPKIPCDEQMFPLGRCPSPVSQARLHQR